MNDQELRALVRDAVARHLSGAPGAPGAPGPSVTSALRSVTSANSATSLHSSHGMYRLVNIGESCVIEPSVTCNHCGYCKSHGH